MNVGDIVLGYDLTSLVLSGGDEWSVENAFVNSFVMPDVVIVRKARGIPIEEAEERSSTTKSKAKSSASKKRGRRMQREEKKQKQLDAAATRMGLGTDKDVHLDEDAFDGDNELAITQAMERVQMDDDLVEDLEAVERELRLVEGAHDDDGDDDNQMKSSV